MTKEERVEVLNIYRKDAHLSIYRNLRRTIVNHIDILERMDKIDEPYGSETGLVYENTAYTLEHLFICAHMCLCYKGPDVDEMSHLNYMSVKYCNEQLQLLDEYWLKDCKYRSEI